MTAFLQKDLTTIAFCWRLERRDGVTIGFTTHDRDIEVEGFVYRAAPGMLPSSITLSDGFEIDMLDVEGALTSDAIGPADLAAGRWDGASVRIFMVDWEAPSEGLFQVARGELGDVTVKGETFEAELKGPTAQLERQVVELTSPECRARLGDKRCRVDMAARVRMRRVVGLVEPHVIELEEAIPAGLHQHGRLRWLGGGNSGLESAILSCEAARLTLREAPPFAPEAGDLIEISEGCDKSLATCSGRFGNAENFRGEPHLPGMDLLTRYPGA